uniref:Uncharacterized protein n=1 Tax=Meloidogyne enterolobii TaxID=390850 RepID=A0A6V7VQA0_MELEN|nr:unnamed protein product [Meloidogyne enterolobii]
MLVSCQRRQIKQKNLYFFAFKQFPAGKCERERKEKEKQIKEKKNLLILIKKLSTNKNKKKE